ncbi:MAG: hypothetical protein JKY19_16185 [Alcanivoracaceae bacterium]|nr:hypothetical protein [Alcanivoracaceae bacterium]
MKLTEQQLAQMFKNSRKTDINNDDVPNESDLYSSTAASDNRLAAVEKIADDSQLSASYQIINQLHDWSVAIGTDIQLSIKPTFSTTILNWLKPSLATAVILTTVYFVSPQINDEVNTLQKPDRIMFTSSFEGNNDLIKGASFDATITTTVKPDRISRNNFS